jgi:hypothetical protein
MVDNQSENKDMSENKGESEYDFFKDSIIRYSAFANDVGEVLRSKIGSKLANLSWGITGVYALSDTVWSGYKTYNKTHSKQLAFNEFGDVFIWQLFASVIITPLILKTGCMTMEAVLHKSAIANRLLHPTIKNYAPHVITIGVGIPVVVPYGDEFVDTVMDTYYRTKPKNHDHLSHNFLWGRIIKSYPSLKPSHYIH